MRKFFVVLVWVMGLGQLNTNKLETAAIKNSCFQFQL